MSSRSKKLAAAAITGGFTIASGIFYATSDIQSMPLSEKDDIFNSKYYTKYNPNRNPPIHDMHVIKVPLNQIDPKLLENPNDLLARCCGGIWAGAGFTPQRVLHTYFDRSDATQSQLWSPSELLQSDYQVGTDIAGNFEVIDRSEGYVLIRGGDKTSNRGLRPLDALIDVTAHINKEENVAEFGLKSLFFQGTGTASKLPMPGPVIWLHEMYAKILLKSGVNHVRR